jgi:hypothetical protein
MCGVVFPPAPSLPDSVPNLQFQTMQKLIGKSCACSPEARVTTVKKTIASRKEMPDDVKTKSSLPAERKR